MSIYKGSTQLTGGFTPVDNELSTTSTNPVQNKVVSETFEDLGISAWQKPADWIDMRNAAVANSVYLLVGHAADYSAYNELTLKAVVSSSGTYNVFVDGIKIATTASNTDTAINWQTLALTSGWDVTYPSALRTHIVRITPTDPSHNITATRLNSTANQGVLWVHSTLTNNAEYTLGSSSIIANPLLEAVTCSGATLKVSDLNNFVANCGNLVYLPKIEGATNAKVNYSFYRCQKLKKVHLVGFAQNNVQIYNSAPFDNCKALTSIIFENCKIRIPNWEGATALKKFPAGNTFHNTQYNDIRAIGLSSLQDTFFDTSDATTCKRAQFQGTSSVRCDGIKGVTVSSSAPFDGTSPQINVSYTGLNRVALVNLFNSLPTVSASQVINITGATGADDLTAADLAIATGKGWTVTR